MTAMGTYSRRMTAKLKELNHLEFQICLHPGGLMRRLSMILAVIILCCLSTSLYGGVILFENFDELMEKQGVMSAGAFSTINNTNVDIVANGGIFGYPCQPPESGTCIDLGGTAGYPGDPTGQLQSNMLFPAGSYFLSFDLIGSQRGVMASTTVTFGNYNQTFTLASQDDSSGIVANQLVTLNSPGYLLFVSDTPGNIDNYLDDVVVATASATPEPSSLILMGSGLLLAAIRFRRR
jgi:PEP-CTERM motif